VGHRGCFSRTPIGDYDVTGPTRLIYNLGGLLAIVGAMALLAAEAAPIFWLLPLGGLACTALGVIIMMLTSGVSNGRWSSILTAAIVSSGIFLLAFGRLKKPHPPMVELIGSLLIIGAAIFWLWRMRTAARS
jgi:hypothetical protein